MIGLKAFAAAVLGLFAVATIGLALWSLAGFSLIEATLMPVSLLLAVSQFAGFSTIARRLDRQSGEIADLGGATGTFINDIRDLKIRLDDIDDSVDERVKTGAEAVWAEVQVLETLVKQLAESVAHSNLGTIRSHPLTPSADPDADDHAEEPADDAALLETIRRSLAENRVDLYLQPVVTLPQRKTRYYEGLSRLRSTEGEIIMPASYLPVAEPAGMMPIIDNLLLFRCVQVVRRLFERDREIGVFCNISAHSLLDAEFFPQFVEFMEQNTALAGSVIFEFPQRMVSGFGPLEEQSLAALSDLGFVFSMDQVNDLDIDFAALGAKHFKFLKVEADILLNRMRDAGAPVDGPDFSELLSRQGIELIAEKIENERSVVNLLDFDIALAQGFLFGEPKPVRHDLIETDPAALKASA